MLETDPNEHELPPEFEEWFLELDNIPEYEENTGDEALDGLNGPWE